VKAKERERLARQRRPKTMKIQLVITMDPATGDISFSGTVPTPPVALWMLKKVEAALLRDPKSQQRIVVPQPVIGTPS